MADTVLMTLSCPTCGGALRAENANDSIVCVYCGNTIVPMGGGSNFGGVPTASVTATKISGIRNSSSALAYIESFFDSFNWDDFVYTSEISINEIDGLVDSLLVTSADDKNTWILAFLAAYTPYVKKAASCGHVLDSVINSYEVGDFDAYSRFDAYKRIVESLAGSRGGVVSNLEKSIANAGKYGASSTELFDMNSKLDEVKNFPMPPMFETIEDIPQVQENIRERNESIRAELLEEGIDAEEEYNKALAAMESKRYTAALDILTKLMGYRDSDRLIRKADKLFTINGILEIGGNIYYLQKQGDGENYNLYEEKDRRISGNPILTKIARILTNYANIIYYIDVSNKLHRYDLATRTSLKVYKTEFDPKCERLYSGKYMYIITRGQGDDSYATAVSLVSINLSNGEIKTVLKEIKRVSKILSDHIVYTENDKGVEITKICDLNGENIITVGRAATVECEIDGAIVYTKTSPNKFNKDIYILSQSSEHRLVEKNIYKFEGVYADKLFYYVGSAYRSSLININLDGTQRREMPPYISDVLFVNGEHIYFIRRAGHNAILSKSHIDGSDMSVIAGDIENYITLKNGYLYYLDYRSQLIRIRMDGSGRQELCNGVKKVLFVTDNKIVFVSRDGTLKGEGFEISRKVESIYQIDLLGEGIRKLAYDVKHAEQYDDNFVYYISQKTAKDGISVDALYSLNLHTGEATELVEIKLDTTENNYGCLISGVVAFLSIVLLIAGVVNDAAPMMLIGGLGATVSLIAGIRNLTKTL